MQQLDELKIKKSRCYWERMGDFFFFLVVHCGYVPGFVPSLLLTFACRLNDGGGIRRLPECWALIFLFSKINKKRVLL